MGASQLGRSAAVAFGLASSVRGSWGPPANYAISVSDDGRFLQEANGSPFFWQADTAWLLTLRLNYTEADTYLADRASKGYNIIMNSGLTEIGIDAANRNGDLPLIDEDFARPNEPYWDYMDSIIELAWTKHNLRMALIPAWGNYLHDVAEPGPITEENGEAFGHFIGERYPYLPKVLFGDINPYWADQDAIVADYNAGGIPGSHPSTDFTPVYDALAAGIVAGERSATGRGEEYWPLLTVHCRNQWMPDAPIALASANLGDRDYLTLDVSQSGHSDISPHPPVSWWNARRGYEPVEIMWAAGGKHRRRPVIDNEPHYERRWSRKDQPVRAPWNATDVRVGAWQTALSGAAGVSYGNDNVWQMYIPDLMEPPTSGIAEPWDVAINDPGAGQMQSIKNAILDRGERSFFNRVPAQDALVSDAGTEDRRVTALRDSEGSWIMVYTPTGEPFTVDVSSLEGAVAKASWFNPVDGEYTEFDVSEAVNGPNPRKKIFVPPQEDGHPDWTLILEAGAG